MEHILYNSIEEMIRPDTLSGLEHKTFTATRLAPFQKVSWGGSGSTFLAVHTTNGHQTNNGNGPHYVVKRVSREWDWIMNATGDRYGRTTTLWQHGILDRLPKEIEHAVVACAVDGMGRAILMRDVRETFLPVDEQPISEKDQELILDAMAALHAAFWEDPILQHPTLNLYALEQIFSWTSAEKARQVLAVCPTEVLEWVIGGWDLLPEYVEADVADLLRSLARDPSPLCTALARFPRTLVHGDIRLANLGVVHGESPRLILLDWMIAAATVPTLDLTRYLLEHRFPSGKEAAIDFYKKRLAQRLGDRFDESLWQPQLELSFLASFLMFACFKAWVGTHHKDEECRIRQRAVFPWCSEYARAWAKWLPW